ncbi:MAG: hypothetical protein ACXAEN_22625, partial [Candidatus Thorarchaeota archaeon]
RPYLIEDEDMMVICEFKGRVGWAKYESNTGGKFDLCIIDPDARFFEDAKRMRTKMSGQSRNRSRIPIYPQEAFKAVVEFKVRAVGNKPSIEKDLRKLATLCSSDSSCVGYFVLLDRSASENILRDRRELFEEVRRETKSRINYLDQNRRYLLNGKTP